MSKEIKALEAKIQQLEARLEVVENQQARGEIAARLREVETTLAAWQKFNATK